MPILKTCRIGKHLIREAGDKPWPRSGSLGAKSGWGLGLLVLLAVSCSAGWAADLSPAELGRKYDEAFFAHDYFLARRTISALRTLEPGNMTYHREWVKMLGATCDEEPFLREMLQLRESRQPGALEAFFNILHAGVIPPALLQKLRVRFVLTEDRFVLANWSPDALRGSSTTSAGEVPAGQTPGDPGPQPAPEANSPGLPPASGEGSETLSGLLRSLPTGLLPGNLTDLLPGGASQESSAPGSQSELGQVMELLNLVNSGNPQAMQLLKMIPAGNQLLTPPTPLPGSAQRGASPKKTQTQNWESTVPLLQKSLEQVPALLEQLRKLNRTKPLSKPPGR